ncbi:DUF202 domain-containing protein [Candidatus Woesearchaeota archaeon]|nr:DUF202 domain-containing protein [Candidatus Woesearchaeota archaeon]
MKIRDSLQSYMSKDKIELVNKRKLLAYIRTALTFCLTGLVLIIFFLTKLTAILGIIFLILAALIFGYGYVRFGHYERRINHLK